MNCTLHIFWMVIPCWMYALQMSSMINLSILLVLSFDDTHNFFILKSPVYFFFYCLCPHWRVFGASWHCGNTHGPGAPSSTRPVNPVQLARHMLYTFHLPHFLLPDKEWQWSYFQIQSGAIEVVDQWIKGQLNAGLLEGRNCPPSRAAGPEPQLFPKLSPSSLC